MAGSFPASVTAYTNPGPTDPTATAVGARTHDQFHADNNDDLEQVMTKLGTGASIASASTVLRGTGSGTTAFGQVVSADITDLTIVNGDIATAAGIVVSKLAAGGAANRVVLTTDGTTMTLGQIAAAQIANDTITATQLAPDCVGASELADSSVATANIIAGSVTQRLTVTDSSGASIGVATGDIPGMTLSPTTAGGDLLVFVVLTTYNGTVNAAGNVTVNLDGATTQVSLVTTAVANGNNNMGGTILLTGVSAGAHTLKLQWTNNLGTMNRNGTSTLGMIEIKR